MPQVLQHFGEDPSKGFSDAQVLEQRAIYGPNELAPEKGTPFWKLVLKQFDDLLVKILIVAAIVDLVIAIINGETGASVFVEPGVIILILVANGEFWTHGNHNLPCSPSDFFAWV
jgi:P-type Ca2+ transporter type 2A